jgi:hypothetical protein
VIESGFVIPTRSFSPGERSFSKGLASYDGVAKEAYRAVSNDLNALFRGNRALAGQEL